MPPLRVTCPQCQRVTVLDSEKVPDQPVSYRCPSCQTKIVVDKRRLLAGGGDTAAALAGIHAAADAVAAVPPPAANAETPAANGASASAPQQAAAATDPVLELTLPPGESLPPCILVAEDRVTAAQLQRVLEPFDTAIETFTDVAAARERVLQEPPPLVIWVAGAVSKPPYAALDALAGLPPRERRAILLVLVAENVKTLDGNLAFLYGANLLLGKRHLQQAPAILYSALRTHQRLYRPFLAAAGE